MNKLSKHFLISMPHMGDGIFNKSIIYMCEHDEDGAMGMIINKPIPSLHVANILKQTRLDNAKPPPDVYFGGPVGIDQGFILHDADYRVDGTQKISDILSLTTNPQIVDDIINGSGPGKFRFTMGYAGWGKDQLDREFENGDWLVLPADPEIIFNMPDHQKWSNAANQLGIDILDISGHTGFA